MRILEILTQIQVCGFKMGELVVVDSGEDSRMEVEKMEEEEEERERGVVRWEEYLPRMVIRVLLVEADDSTRQIIAALLRKCNYKGHLSFSLLFNFSFVYY